MYRKGLVDETSSPCKSNCERHAYWKRRMSHMKTLSADAIIDITDGSNIIDVTTVSRNHLTSPNNQLESKSYIDEQLSRLSEATRHIVRTTFDEMAKDAVRNGLFIFTSLFARHPRYKLIWPQLRTVPYSHLMSSPYCQRHASTYMSALRTIIDCLDDDERLAHILKRIANAHLKWNIHKFHLMDMVESVRDIAWSCNKLGYQRHEVDAAWTLLYDVVANFINFYRERALEKS